jgi:crossover junction endodeoxyribonuclease RuvC
MGIDPGIATVGFGVIEAEANKIKPIRYGVISTPAGLRLALRLQQIYRDMCQLIDTFHPDAISVEELFFNTNITTGIAVAHGRGVAILAGEEKQIPMFEYTPLQVKQCITGYGRAEKKQMMEMVRRLLNLDAVPRPDDAADAWRFASATAGFPTHFSTLTEGTYVLLFRRHRNDYRRKSGRAGHRRCRLCLQRQHEHPVPSGDREKGAAVHLLQRQRGRF